MEVVLGIDIGGTNTKFGLIDKEGKIYQKSSIETKGNEPAVNLFERIFSLVKNLPDIKLKGIGVGAPCGNYYAGTIDYPPNMNWGLVDLNSIIKDYFDVPFKVTNDANAAAFGEKVFGAGKNFSNFIEVTLGTGLGSGIIVNGNIFHGSNGFAGEMGHITVVENGRECGCGKLGCLETYISATGICRTAVELLSHYNVKSKLREIKPEEITSKLIYELALDGDKIAVESFNKSVKLLAKAFADVAHLFDPEAFILFGGLANAHQLLLEPLKEEMEKLLMPVFKDKIKILRSNLPEGDAAILGSGALIWSN